MVLSKKWPPTLSLSLSIFLLFQENNLEFVVMGMQTQYVARVNDTLIFSFKK